MTSNRTPQRNVWISLWFHPRDTIRELIDRNLKDPRIIWLAILNGILIGFSFLATLWMRFPERAEWRGPGFITVSLIGGALIGVIQLYFFAWLYKVVGRWLKGKGQFQELKLALGWSLYPLIVAEILNLIAIFLISHPILQGIVLFLHLVALVWSIVVIIGVIAEAHRFSAGRSIGTLIISFVLLLIIFLIISFVITLLTSGLQSPTRQL